MVAIGCLVVDDESAALDSLVRGERHVNNVLCTDEVFLRPAVADGQHGRAIHVVPIKNTQHVITAWTRLFDVNKFEA